MPSLRDPDRQHAERRSLVPTARWAMAVFSVSLMFGCDNVPTFNEVTGQGQAPAPVAEKPAEVNPVVSQPVPVAQVAPQVDDSAQVISAFKNKPTFDRTDNDLKRLCNLPSGLDGLTEMDLTASTGVTDVGVKLLSKLVNLETLTLSGTRVTADGLSVIQELPKLTRLSLNTCNVVSSMVQQIAKVEQLMSLSLEGTRVTDTDVELLIHLDSLKELNLKGAPITDLSLKHAGSLKSLETLNISATTISGEGAQFLRRKQNEAGLKELYASQSQFGLHGMKYLQGMETLEVLDASGAEISNVSLQSLKGVVRLRKLLLGFNQFNDQGTVILGSLKSVEELSLHGCSKVTDRTMSFLAKNKELKRLNVEACGGVTEAGGVRPLKKLLPDCEIQFMGTKY